jgi:hypothetical protein
VVLVKNLRRLLQGKAGSGVRAYTKTFFKLFWYLNPQQHFSYRAAALELDAALLDSGRVGCSGSVGKDVADLLARDSAE